MRQGENIYTEKSVTEMLVKVRGNRKIWGIKLQNNIEGKSQDKNQ